MTLETPTHSNEAPSGFESILYLRSREKAPTTPKMPDCFPDLLLDQVVESITAGREESQLVPLFYDHLADIDEIIFRHEVWRDLENAELTDTFRAFTTKMRDVRLRLSSAKKTRFAQQSQGFHLDAVVQYCKDIEDLVVALSSIDLSSRGLNDFKTFITSYVDQSEFKNLAIDSQRLKQISQKFGTPSIFVDHGFASCDMRAKQTTAWRLKRRLSDFSKVRSLTIVSSTRIGPI